MVGDTSTHLAITRLCSRQVNDAQPGFGRPIFGQSTLARTGTAKDQFFHAFMAFSSK
jgi:hypothetical protein